MELTQEQLAFLEQNRSAAMITLRGDGTPVAVRVGVAMVDGKLWSSGTQDRVRTRWLRRDPRSTLFVYEAAGFRFLNIECRVSILEGPEVPEQSVRLFRAMQRRPSGPLLWTGKETSEEDFLRTMVDERRLVYEFHPLRASGL